jgi:antitoxin (DNA-binding transcriptional repressor) of toxin-antitoxin stability system
MRTVGVREFKNKLSQYLRLVKAGQEIAVTERGHVVAEIRPPGLRDVPEGIPPAWVELARQGLLRLPSRPNDPSVYRRMPKVTPDGTAARLLDEERGDR